MKHKTSRRISPPRSSPRHFLTSGPLPDWYPSKGRTQTKYENEGHEQKLQEKQEIILRTRSSLRHDFVENLDRNQLPDYRPYYSRFLRSTESVRGGVEGGVSCRHGGVISSKANLLKIPLWLYNDASLVLSRESRKQRLGEKVTRGSLTVGDERCFRIRYTRNSWAFCFFRFSFRWC